jgi:hypothetical protein
MAKKNSIIYQCYVNLTNARTRRQCPMTRPSKMKLFGCRPSPFQLHRHPTVHCTAAAITHCYCATAIVVSYCYHCHSCRLPLCCCCRPVIHCTTTVDTHCDRAAAVVLSHCDTRHHPSPPRSPIAIMLPSCHQLRCYHHQPLQLR